MPSRAVDTHARIQPTTRIRGWDPARAWIVGRKSCPSIRHAYLGNENVKHFSEAQ